MVTCAIQRPSGRRVILPSLLPRFFAMCRFSSVLYGLLLWQKARDSRVSLACPTLRFCLLPCLQPSHYFFSTFPIDTKANQRAISVYHCPKSRFPIACYPHDVRSRKAMGQSVCPAPGWCYRPLHQPSAVLWLYHVRPSLWFWRIATPCLAHQPSAAGARSLVEVT